MRASMIDNNVAFVDTDKPNEKLFLDGSVGSHFRCFRFEAVSDNGTCNNIKT
jgi:hypothetical protein